MKSSSWGFTVLDVVALPPLRHPPHPLPRFRTAMAHSFPSSALHSESSIIHESQAPSHSPKHVAQQDPPTPRGWVQRSEFFTWNFFTANMGTGAIAILVNSAPAFRGQREIGTIWFFFDLVRCSAILNETKVADRVGANAGLVSRQCRTAPHEGNQTSARVQGELIRPRRWAVPPLRARFSSSFPAPVLTFTYDR